MKYLLPIVFCLFTLSGFTQTYLVKGKITDQTGSPVAFASVYQKGTTKGTSANGDGDFQLRLSAGLNNLVFKAIGYTQESREITLKADLVLNVTLKSEVYVLKDIRIGSSEDPAYAIIRNAIKKRKTYLHEPERYSCNVYIKGLQRVLEMPKRFLGKNLEDMAKRMGLDSNRTGIIYLSESESKYTVKPPDDKHEEMISSKVSGNNQAFSFNRASELDVNFYENYMNWEGLTNRPLLSPIAESALSYYKYQLVGTSMENGLTINKIQVTPRRKAEPLFTGFIYIIDDSWRIDNVELYLTKDANINFVDTVKVKQQFYPVQGNIWMPSTVRFDFVGGMFGFRFGGYYTAVYRDYEIDPDVPKKLFSELMKVTKDVNKKDSTYWKEARPVPLTDEEKNDYKRKERLASRRESTRFRENADRRRNRLRPKQLLYGDGYTHRNRVTNTTFHLNSLLSSGFYNTVEGFGIDYGASFRKQIDSSRNRYLSLNAKARYGFANHQFLPSISGYLPVDNFPINFSAGSDMLDLNNQDGQTTFGNTVNSLLFERNLIKYYRKDFASIGASRRLGPVSFSAQTEWSNRKWLPNSSDFTIRDRPNRSFTSNNPFTPAADVPLFAENQSFRVNLRATYEFSRKYVTYPTGRYYLASKYPMIALNYVKGIKGILGSDVDYDLLTTSISKEDVPAGFYGKFTFFAGAGKFLNHKSVFYPDDKHFAGNQSLRFEPKINGFLYLPIYEPSTADEYVQLNVQHNFSGFFLDKIPLIRKLKFQELVGFNYLSTPSYTNYREYYFGLQYLSLKAYYGYAYRGGTQVDRGFRIVIGL